MTLIFVALFALSGINKYFPPVELVRTASNAELAQVYSKACLGFLRGPELGQVDLIPTMQTLLASPQLFSGKKNMEKVDLEKLRQLFSKVCKEDPDLTAFDGLETDLKEAVAKLVEIKNSLPDVQALKTLRLSQSRELKSADGNLIGEIYAPNGRRRWVSLQSLPAFIPKLFVGVEDRRFYEHHGIDELGVLRAMISNSGSKARPAGASTLTQQVARNIFLDDSLSFERKIREIILSNQIEKVLSKDQILEFYLNLIYFGRNSWGIEKAANSYFGKSAKDLTFTQAAYLAGIVHSPNAYQTKNQKTLNRLSFVLNKSVEEKIIPSSIDISKELESFSLPAKTPTLQTSYFKDFLQQSRRIRATPSAGINSVQDTAIQTTLDVGLQKISETALRRGLINYEKESRRYRWTGAKLNISDKIAAESERLKKRELDRAFLNEKMSQSLADALDDTPPPKAEHSPASSSESTWLVPLQQATRIHPSHLDEWQVAVVIANSRIGLRDGTTAALSRSSLAWASPLRFGDIIFVSQVAGKPEYEIQQAPEVNGAVVIMEAATGRVLSMVGGFSYRLSTWNGAVRATRQPGSLVKPFMYMGALEAPYQPNTVLKNTPITFPSRGPGDKPWTPQNYEGETSPPRSMRWALAHSNNIMTAHLMDLVGLGPLGILSQELGVYDNPKHNLSFLLGSQDTNLLSAVKGYAAIANGGFRVEPHLTMDEPIQAKPVTSADAISLFQTRYLMQGVLEQGTAARIKDLADSVAGKTGTTDDMNDAWFVGFTPNIVVGVHVGYDKKRSLGRGFAGGNVALPIFEEIIRASFKSYKPRQPFPPPPPGVVFLPTDRETGEILPAMRPNAVMEAYRASEIKQKK